MALAELHQAQLSYAQSLSARESNDTNSGMANLSNSTELQSIENLQYLAQNTGSVFSVVASQERMQTLMREFNQTVKTKNIQTNTNSNLDSIVQRLSYDYDQLREIVRNYLTPETEKMQRASISEVRQAMSDYKQEIDAQVSEIRNQLRIPPLTQEKSRSLGS